MAVSVSHQSMASLAVRFDLPIKECEQKLTGFLKSLGMEVVFAAFAQPRHV